MKVNIHPAFVKGSLYAPSSKSSMQRACAAALVRKGESLIINPGHSDDDKASLDAALQLGATLERVGGNILIKSMGVAAVTDYINHGESGLGIRMFAPLAALNSHEITLDGKGSLLGRPMSFFDEIFPELGITVQSNNGKLPLKIKGPLVPKNIEVDGSLSSQFLTGLLFAYSAAGATNVSITVNNLKSKPYIDLTLDVMQQFGLQVPVNEGYHSFFFKGTFEHHEQRIEYQVEGDWSGGAFLLVAGAIAGDLVVSGLNIHSTQADRAILNALIDSGSNIIVKEKEIHIKKATLHPFIFDATDCPDLFPPLVALAANCDGVSSIRGCTRLANKESDRGLTLQLEFAKLGVKVDIDGDIMYVTGSKVFNSTEVYSHHDHRIAMACATAALCGQGPVTIHDAEAINKSYPDFFDDLSKIGVLVD